MSKKATEHVTYDIDELIGFGTVKLSSATIEAFKAEFEAKETGHHVGSIALIHSSRAAVNDRLEDGAAQRRYLAEFGVHNPNALAYYRSLPEETLPGEVAEVDPLSEPYGEEVPLPEHPVVENAPPETPEHEWIRKEQEAKEHPAA
jgi:hypothetical protein